jgi:branched-chain amino acid aminotransferase
METTETIWMNGKLVPWDSATTHVLTHTLHYGGGVFEGIRCYKTDKGTAIFRLKEHMERLMYSADVLDMEVGYSVEELTKAVIKTVRENGLEQGYIRPLIYFGYGKMGLNPVGAPVDTIVACWPWGKYLSHDAVKVQISDYIRIHPQSTVSDAKITGHYVNSILAVLALKGTDFHEALFLDYEGNVAEGPGENLFLVKDGTILTPQKKSILPGITRDTVKQIANDLGHDVKEMILSPDDLWSADEAFFTGTAAEVSPIASINDHVYGEGTAGPITSQIKEAYMNVVHGRSPSYDHYLTLV